MVCTCQVLAEAFDIEESSSVPPIPNQSPPIQQLAATQLKLGAMSTLHARTLNGAVGQNAHDWK